METNKVDIIKGPSKEESAEIYKAGSKKDVCFEIHYGYKRMVLIDILEIIGVQQTSVKMLASMPAGFFVYSQGEDPRSNSEKLESIQVHIFYTTNTGKGYIEKVPKEESVHSKKIKNPGYVQDVKEVRSTLFIRIIVIGVVELVKSMDPKVILDHPLLQIKK